MLNFNLKKSKILTLTKNYQKINKLKTHSVNTIFTFMYQKSIEILENPAEVDS